MQYGVFYAYIKLKEQEIRYLDLTPPTPTAHTDVGVSASPHLLSPASCRNLVWIAECISQQLKSKINNYIPIFKD
jgi:V-type H+-transporting ATPase subunit d